MSQTAAKHTHRQWLALLKQLNRETLSDLTLHSIADNYATHKHVKVKSWIQWRSKRHPTCSSWMNLVERFSRDLTENVVLQASFTSVDELAQAMTEYLGERNLAPKSYVWKKKEKEILETIQRTRAAPDKTNR